MIVLTMMERLAVLSSFIVAVEEVAAQEANECFEATTIVLQKETVCTKDCRDCLT
jgi:hypothetical protein